MKRRFQPLFARTQRPPPQRRRVRPAVEALEDRTVPTVFPVTNLGDAGAGSLRDAIALANAANDPDTIVFAPSIRGGPVELTSADPATTAATNTERLAGPSALVVRSPITILGTGEMITRADGAVNFRLFQVTGDGNLTLRDLTLSNGLAQGGGGSASGGGGGAGLGGAIYNQATLSLVGCTLVGNQAIGGDGGGVGDGVGGGGGMGQGASGSHGGGPNGGTAGVSGGFGGGGGGSVSGRGGVGGFGGGGGSGGYAGEAGGFGGGSGGGYRGGYVNIVPAFGGGGGGSGDGGGGGGMGGAVFNQGGTVALANSTITANTARGGDASGTAQNGGGYGGGLFNLNGTLTLTNVTVAGNTVQTGTGGADHTKDGTELYNASVYVVGVTPYQTATVILANSILAHTGFTSALFNYKDAASSGKASIPATGPNLVFGYVGNDGGTVLPTFLSADPQLGSLANNGGPTMTMALGEGSPARNAGSNAAASTAGLTTDQRGFGPRAAGGVPDLGAFELGAVPPPPTPGGGQAGVPLPLPGARVVSGDLTGDGKPERIVGAKGGQAPFVEVFSGRKRVRRFRAFGNGYRYGLLVSLGDVNGDGKLEILVRPKIPARLRRRLKAPGVKAFSAQGALVDTLSINDPRFGG